MSISRSDSSVELCLDHERNKNSSINVQRFSSELTSKGISRFKCCSESSPAVTSRKVECETRLAQLRCLLGTRILRHWVHLHRAWSIRQESPSHSKADAKNIGRCFPNMEVALHLFGR